MKKTCNRCIAQDQINYHCILGYKQLKKTKNVLGSLLEDMSPAENCPKPITIKEYIKLKPKQ